MTGLVPGQVYYYSYGQPPYNYSAVHSFRAAPSPGQEYPIKFLVYHHCTRQPSSLSLPTHMFLFRTVVQFA